MLCQFRSSLASGYYPDHRHYHQRLLGLILIGLAAPGKIWLFILFFFVLQRIEGDILYPKIVGKSVGLSEIWVWQQLLSAQSLRCFRHHRQRACCFGYSLHII